jgi:hypothetical protein
MFALLLGLGCVVQGCLGQHYDASPFTLQEIQEAAAKWEAVKAMHDAMKAANVTSKNTCSVDLRSQLLGCHQVESNWCWATVTADVGHFFRPSFYQGCDGLECQVAGHQFDAADPKSCCRDKSKCDKGAWGIVEGIHWLLQSSSDTYTKDLSGPKSQDELDAMINAGDGPVIAWIQWGATSSHVILIGGCSQSGQYYVHDPEDDEGSFKEVSYSDLLSYDGGKYSGTVYPINAGRNEISTVVV